MKRLKIVYIGLLTTVLQACTGTDYRADAFGNFESLETIISAEANGKLLRINIQQGQQLTAGKVIGLIDTVQLALTRKQLAAKRQAIESKLQGIDANTAVLLTEQDNIATEHARIKRLISGKAATKRQLDQVEGQLDLVKSRIKSTNTQKNSIYAELKALDAQLEITAHQLTNCHLTNPINGTVLEKYVEQHELVAMGKPIYKIADLSNLHLRIYISGSQLPHIKLGQELEVLIDQDRETNSSLKGTVTWISETAEFTPKIIQTKEERVNLVYAVKVRVPNDGRIKIGMPGEVRFSANK